jgi:hypothetical protein
VVKPAASRKESKEIYILAMRFKGSQDQDPNFDLQPSL